MMPPADLERLKEKINDAIVALPAGAKVAVVGWCSTAFELAALPAFAAGAAKLEGIFAPQPVANARPLDELAGCGPDIVVIAEDAGKEALLEAVAARVPASTRLLIGGYAHYDFRDEIFDRVSRDLFIPSLANGYPHCLVHIYQCLRNAHRRGLSGVVAEFGMFKGGTTMLMSRFIEELGASWKVYGFDTFDGFPPRRSPLDMYNHPDCVFLNVDLVRAVFSGRNVEVVEGDVVSTVGRLADQDLVLSFVDTDNFTSASAIVDLVAERTLVGGAVIFDHWAGHGRYLDTVGERIAARKIAEDHRYFNLHGTGVFLRQA
jgi:O-methyltransferase